MHPDWQLINSFSGWFSAAGTILAVAVSLFISFSARSTKIAVTSGIYLFNETHPTAFVLSFTMVVAIFSVHIGNGLFLANNGYEFGLALLATTVSFAISGAGKLSLDNLLANRIK